MARKIAVASPSSARYPWVRNATVTASTSGGSPAMAARLLPLRWLAVSDVGVRVHAPAASAVELVRFDETGTTELGRTRLERRGAQWVGQVAAGTVYGLVAADAGVRSDPSKVLLDPAAREVLFPAGFSRRAAARHGVPNSGRGPLAVARPATAGAAPSRRSTRPPVVYEVHVRGFTRRRAGPGRGTFAGVVADLDRLSALGVTVIELMPVHQNDPDEGSYWGYMPLAFGAVHRQYAAADDAWGELGDLVAAAHDRDIEVWLDVVFNHTTEIDETGPDVPLPWAGRRRLLRPRRRRRLHRDERLRQRHRHLVAGRRATS